MTFNYKSFLKMFPFLLMVILLFPQSSGCSAKNSGPHIVINEVVSSNSSSLVDAALGSPDWVELRNTGDKSVNLFGYRLTNKRDSTNCTFGNVSIPAGGYLDVFATKNSVPAGATACLAFSISKSGEKLYLIDPNGMVLHQLAVPALQTDVSYALRSDGNYGFCTSPTPGRKNDDGGILEAGKLKATLSSSALTLSEVLPRPEAGTAWAELHNMGKEDINLANYTLTDSRGNPGKWQLPQRTLSAGEYAVVDFSGEAAAGGDGDMQAPFRLGSKDLAIYMYDVTGVLVNSLTWQAGIPEGVSAVSGGGYTAFPTKGNLNSPKTFPSSQPVSMDAADPVRVSEVLPKNKYGVMDSDKCRYAWVELHNGSAQAVSFSGYYLSDNKDKLLKWAFPDVTMEAGGYLLVFLSGTQSKPEELHASFRLSQGETAIYLTDSNTFRVDTLALPGEIGSDISVGRGPGGNPQYYGRPSPGSVNAGGASDLRNVGYFSTDGVYISEACAVNSAKSDENDWVELHNGGNSSVNLAGYYLSDDASNPKKWQIPQLSIAANGYTVIQASADPARQSASTAPFGISPEGETLLLSDAAGMAVDSFETGKLSVGLTSGRVEGNNTINLAYFSTPTPGRPNPGQYCTQYAAPPVFSQTGLYQAKAFELTLASATPDAKIYYTLDGSLPTTTSKLYTGPISISKNTPVRAIASAQGLLPSPVATETYLFDAPHTVPVICISGNPSQMNYLVNTDDRRDKPEYLAQVEYYEADGSLGVTFPSGVRPKGRSSLDNPQNSLTMRMRGAYGQGSMSYPFFPGSAITTYTTLTLRDSGQDARTARMRDSYFAQVVKGMDVDCSETRTVVAYINGQYSGIYDLDQEQNADYAASHYGLSSKQIDVIDRNGTVLAGDNKEFLRVSRLAQTADTKDDLVFADLSKFVDVDACMDYLIAQTYFGDGDVINQRLWRAQDYSVKWRPLLYDLDWCMRFNDADRNVFGRYFTPNPKAGNGTVTDMYIYCALKKNKAWCDRFVERYVQLAETQFSPDRILGIFDSMEETMKPEMQMHIDRWHTPRSMAVWQGEAGELREALAKRQAIALKQVQQFFHVSNETMQQYIKKYSGT